MIYIQEILSFEQRITKNDARVFSNINKGFYFKLHV